jgi:hypothetical protein
LRPAQAKKVSKILFKKISHSRNQWLKPIILAMWEAEIGRTEV